MSFAALLLVDDDIVKRTCISRIGNVYCFHAGQAQADLASGYHHTGRYVIRTRRAESGHTIEPCSHSHRVAGSVAAGADYEIAARCSRIAGENETHVRRILIGCERIGGGIAGGGSGIEIEQAVIGAAANDIARAESVRCTECRGATRAEGLYLPFIAGIWIEPGDQYRIAIRSACVPGGRSGWAVLHLIGDGSAYRSPSERDIGIGSRRR